MKEEREDNVELEWNGDVDDREDEEDEEDEGDVEELLVSDVEVLRRVGGGGVVRESVYDGRGLELALSSVREWSEGLSFHDTLWIPWDGEAAVLDGEVVAVNDDLKREEAFVRTATVAAAKGLKMLRDLEGVSSFRRPGDYFAEMVKSDDHMKRVKEKIIYERERIAAAEQRRKQRVGKKESKRVQVEKEQTRRQEAKREVRAVETWRKERLRDKNAKGHKGVADGSQREAFPVELLDFETLEDGKFVRGGGESSRPRVTRVGEPGFQKGGRRGWGVPSGGDPSRSRRGPPRSSKKAVSANRQARDERFGFGGKKRDAKKNDASSASKMDQFSSKRNKSVPRGLHVRGKPISKKKGNRPGKARRMKTRAGRR
mmetsp:Transcript_7328/g.14992  ORF Transcript_7328/g.14992 Transcript_7328/m.14992 type:complete len:372 (-) Transcript_7328:1706-2821(-)